MSDNIIRFSEKELLLLGSLNTERTQVNFNECIFYKKASFSQKQIAEALKICQELSRKNQISLLVKHEDRVSVWVE